MFEKSGSAPPPAPRPLQKGRGGWWVDAGVEPPGEHFEWGGPGIPKICGCVDEATAAARAASDGVLCVAVPGFAF